VVDTRVSYVDWILFREPLLPVYQVWIPYRVRSDGYSADNPLLKVTLPGDVEQEAGGPQEDDCHMTEVGGEDLWQSLRHPIVAFKVVARSYPYQIRLSGLERGPG